jgi:hypothetical protein
MSTTPPETYAARLKRYERGARRFSLRASLSTLLATVATAVLAPAAQAGFGVSLWEAGTCENHTCTYKSVEANHAEAFTQAAGHPPWGITTFELNHTGSAPLAKPEGEPVKRVRVDVPAGLASDPQAPAKCKIEVFVKDLCPPPTEVGTQEATVWTGVTDLELTGATAGHVYNLEPEPGLPVPGVPGAHFEPMPLLFGIHILTEHSFLEGHVAWWSDYHEYFEINNLGKAAPVLKSKLNFNGHAGGNFISLPTECSPVTTTFLEVESWTGEVSKTLTHPPLGVDGCDRVPFKPTAEMTPETSQSDQPDGATTEVKVPQKAGPEEVNTADIKDAHVTLPEGLTLNSAAARGLKACTPAQIRIGSTEPVECPASSKVGEVTIEADLPEKSLAGNVYLGAPEGEPITGPPYTIYVDAESPRYGVSVRLKGQVNPNPATGRLETTFLENPQQPFSDFILKLKGGPQAPLANPLCGTGQVEALFTPYTGLAAALSSTPFTTTGCASPVPFALAQSTQNATAIAGAHTSYTFNLARADGQQYLSQVRTVLPAGLVGVIPSVTLCGEPQAQAGTCPAASQIGTATVNVGAGSEPYAFSGPVFLTGPYNGSPYGLSVPVPAVAGPFNLGTVVTRAAISVDPHTGRVIATSSLPTIVKGVPLRLRNLSVAVNRPNFLLNPTNCGPLATDSTLTSTALATQLVSSAFQVGACGALTFKPSFAASSNARANKAEGALLQVNVTQGAHQANIRSVFTQLPLQLPSRLTTLQKACPEATFAANPSSCPSGSNVGTATAVTPVLPNPLTGPAYLVSHGGAAFPDLDIVLEGNGVRVILVGNTDIKGGITTSNFAMIPDVPVTSFALTLPKGPHSALGAFGSLCAHALVMPTIITAQSGAQVKQNTKIEVAGCPVKILRRRIVHHVLLLTVQTFSAGRLIVTGKSLKSASRSVRGPMTTTIRVRLSSKGVHTLSNHRRLKIRVRVRFVSSQRGESGSTATTAVTFRR